MDSSDPRPGGATPHEIEVYDRKQAVVTGTTDRFRSEAPPSITALFAASASFLCDACLTVKRTELPLVSDVQSGTARGRHVG